MRCAECGCVDELAPGWIALLGRDPDDDDAAREVISFCPVCAWREFDLAKTIAQDYI